MKHWHAFINLLERSVHMPLPPLCSSFLPTSLHPEVMLYFCVNYPGFLFMVLACIYDSLNAVYFASLQWKLCWLLILNMFLGLLLVEYKSLVHLLSVLYGLNRINMQSFFIIVHFTVNGQFHPSYVMCAN